MRAPSTPRPLLSRQVRQDALRATRLFAQLDPAEMDGLVSLVSERRIRRDEAVIRRGETGGSLMVLVQGRLRAGSISADGREVVMSLFEPGQVFGEVALLDGKPRSLDVTAVVDSTVLVLERRDFLPFLRAHPDLMLRLMVLLCERLRRASLALEDAALADLPVRLGRLLLRLAEDYGTPHGQGVRLRVRMSQKDMSAQVAATRESVNRQLRHWRDEGLVDAADGQLVLPRPAALRSLVDAGG